MNEYSVTTPLIEIDPALIAVEQTTQGVMRKMQPEMSHASWGPGYRNLSFLVTHDEKDLLGLICLSTPVPRLGVRDDFLFPGLKPPHTNRLRQYMDMSVCVGAQPCSWHWNLGKLCAMVAPTFGDFVKARYGDELLGLTTTSWHGAHGGRATQYTRIYKLLGETKGYGAAHIDREEVRKGAAWAEGLGFHRDNSLPIGHPHARYGDLASKTLPNRRWHNRETFDAWVTEVGGVEARIAEHYMPDGKGGWSRGDGSDYTKRRATFLKTIHGFEDTGIDLPENVFFHGDKRGVYYHPARAPEERQDVIVEWYARWGLPRYEKTKDTAPPYKDGVTT